MAHQLNPRDLPESALLQQCRWEAFRGPGPGGQKRNKTSSSVRVVHVPTGISALAGESRSQRRNKSVAIQRLRHRLATELREVMREDFSPSAALTEFLDKSGRLGCPLKDERYPRVLGMVLDVIYFHGGSISQAAHRLGITTSNLVGFLQRDGDALSQVNQLRRRASLRALGGAS